MQLYALNHLGEQIDTSRAVKQSDYFCMECGGAVRVRRGEFKRSHFYHLGGASSCRQSGKGAVHLAIQEHLQGSLPGTCFLEKAFPEKKRIADVVWETHQLIFEIQCSPISAEEVWDRNRDYAALGYQVVWILHDCRFNKERVTLAEVFLQNHPHYFTNINETGDGWIYDQWSLIKRKKRVARLPPLPISVAKPCTFVPFRLGMTHLEKKRIRSWLTFFAGDLVCGEHSSYRKEGVKQEARLTGSIRWYKRWYLAVFYLFLEKACR